MAERADCGCPTYRGRAITDRALHATFHELVEQQGGPAGTVDAYTLQAERGFLTGTLTGETLLDRRARASGKRASGALRRASH